MNKSCFIAPIYSKKYNFAEQMVRSYNNFYDDDHLFLIFSDEVEKKLFQNSYPDLRYRSIVFTDDPILLNVEHNPATQKKLFGAKYVFDNTDFDIIGIIDDDSKFIKTMDYDQLFRNHLDKKVLYSTLIPRTENLDNLNTCCLKYFNPYDQNKIQSSTLNFNSFYWFNDIPLFERNDFYAFREYVNLDKVKGDFTKYVFEHMFYVYYLLVTNKVKMEVLNYNLPVPYGGFVELQRYINPDDFATIFRHMEPMWILQPIDESNMKNVFMQVHLDR